MAGSDPKAEARAEAKGSTAALPTTHALACVSCRTRKLKCDRISPKCTRCDKEKNDCKYPMPRRKINFRRRNIKELQARLAEVESYLQDYTKPVEAEEQQPELLVVEEDQLLDNDAPRSNPESESFQSEDPSSHECDKAAKRATDSARPFKSSRSLDMDAPGLPPAEIMEELNRLYFENHHAQMPIVHPGRFWKAFLAGPRRRLPECLMYAMWALAAQSHPKYGHQSSGFYHCARRHIDADEAKANNGWFVTVPHAQTYAIMATYEARCMLFTSGAMSCAKCIRLTNMMSLDRVDETGDDNFSIPWVEAEEKRRTFWGAFIIDTFASISTGLPSLINTEEIMTRLPASNKSFMSSIEEKSPFLEEAFEGASYSRFASTAIICHVFKAIMRHSLMGKSTRNSEDFFNGKLWVQHRELDNRLSTLFMFLPEGLQLPDNIQNLEAIHANLSFHASVISLHHIAVEEAERCGHISVLHTSLARLRASAEEIVGIVKLTSHRASVFMSPLSPMSLYCALSVYVYLAKENGGSQFTSVDKMNMLTVLQCMEAVGRVHKITKAFLYRACRDIEQNDLSTLLNMPALGRYGNMAGEGVAVTKIAGPTALGRQIKRSSVLPHAPTVEMPLEQDAEEGIAFLNGDDKTGEECFESIIGAASRNVAASKTQGGRKQTYKRNWTSTDPASTGPIDITRMGSNAGSSVSDSYGISRTNALQHHFGAMDPTHASSTSSTFNSIVSGFESQTVGSDSISRASFGGGMGLSNVQSSQLREELAPWPMSVGVVFGSVTDGVVNSSVVSANSAYSWGAPDSTMQ